MTTTERYTVALTILIGRTLVKDEYSLQAIDAADAERIAREKCARYGETVVSIEVFRGHFPASYWHR